MTMTTCQHWFRAFLLLVATPLAGAATLRFDPPAPTTLTPVFVNIVFITCPGGNALVTTEGSHVTIRAEASGVCIATFTPVLERLSLGSFPAGAYDVSVTGTALAPASGRLLVRGATLGVQPLGSPTDGGVLVRIDLRGLEVAYPPTYTLTIGGVDATFASHYELSGDIMVKAPPHAAGDVDLVLTIEGKVIAASRAFTYYDPNAEVDPFTFEPILFPIAYNGPGQFGAEWKTENVLAPSFDSALVLHSPSSCGACNPDTPTRLTETGPAGVLLWALRGSADDLGAASRISDGSRTALTAGTEVHVVRERDLQDHMVRLINVPTAVNSRALLRVWTLGQAPYPPRVAIAGHALASGFPIVQGDLTFWSVDITSALAGVSGSSGVNVEVTSLSPAARIWALVSITNNDTQQVTLISPSL